MLARVRGWLHPLVLAALLALLSIAGAAAETPAGLEALRQRIGELSDADKPADALPLAEQALSLAMRLHGPDSAAAAVSLLKLGELLSALDRHAEAEPLERRGWEIRTQALGPADPLTLDAMLAVAGSLRHLQRTDEALALLERAMVLIEAAHGSGHRLVADALEQFASIADAAGRGEEAYHLWQRVLAVREKVLGAEHPDLTGILAPLAARAGKAKDFAAAQGYLARLLPLVEAAQGRDSPIVLALLEGLAAIQGHLGRHADAEATWRRLLEAREKAHGGHSTEVAGVLESLAEPVDGQRRHDEAEALLRRALAMREQLQGAAHLDVAATLLKLRDMLDSRQRSSDALSLAARALAIREQALGPEHPDVAAALRKLAASHAYLARPEAPALASRALAILEKHHGAGSLELISPVMDAGLAHYMLGRNEEARRLYERGVALAEKAGERESDNLLLGLLQLSFIHGNLDRFEDAEAALKRALAMQQERAGAAGSHLFAVMLGLFNAYEATGRDSEAEALLRRAMALDKRPLGASERLADDVVRKSLAALHARAGRFEESEAILRDLAAEWEQRPLEGSAGRGIRAAILRDLADLYLRQSRFADAEPVALAVVGVAEVDQTTRPAALAWSLMRLAQVHEGLGRFPAAHALRQRALALYGEASGGADDLGLAAQYNGLGEHHFVQRQWGEAVQHYRRSTASIARLIERGVRHTGTGVTGEAGGAARAYLRFTNFAKAAIRLAEANPDEARALAGEIFHSAQWAQGSGTARALAQMASRQAAAAGALGPLVRERQDLVVEWDRIMVQRTSALGGLDAAMGGQTPLGARMTPAEEARRMAAIDARLALIDGRLKAEFPDFAALAAAAPATLDEVQAVLAADEALVVFLDTPALGPTPEETLIWVVTQGDVRWLRSDLGSAALAREVAALRCGLDEASWLAPADRPGDSAAEHAANAARRERAEACRTALGREPEPGRGLVGLPFDLARAHRLHAGLLGPAEDIIRGRQLIVVPSGALAQLPFQVLVTAPPPADGDYRKAAWLARSHAITVLPAVSSLTALRRVARPSRATRAMIGFGNPLLDGPDDRSDASARLARERVACPVAPRAAAIAATGGGRAGLATVALRSGRADLAHLHAQEPLPETADELCAVARDLRAPPGDIHLGRRATERAVKALSASGRLAQYRIVHFATHGALAGEIKGAREPGLVMTPPDLPGDEDDGYLSASEIAGLKLDADWVILSACNTAGPAEAGPGTEGRGEALSGLARVFFYAGARTLLVSHWAVASDAAVKLIGEATSEIARGTGFGGAEAMRRAMLARIDRGAPFEAHPAYWSPFIVVGEGSVAPRRAAPAASATPAATTTRETAAGARKAPARPATATPRASTPPPIGQPRKAGGRRLGPPARVRQPGMPARRVEPAGSARPRAARAQPRHRGEPGMGAWCHLPADLRGRRGRYACATLAGTPPTDGRSVGR